MAVRSKTVADAMDRIELLEGIVGKHVEKFDKHVEKQQEFNEAIVARVVEAEKSDLTIGGKLDAILDRLDKKTIGWQIWVPFSFTAIISVIMLLIQIWPKGVTP